MITQNINNVNLTHNLELRQCKTDRTLLFQGGQSQALGLLHFDNWSLLIDFEVFIQSWSNHRFISAPPPLLLTKWTQLRFVFFVTKMELVKFLPSLWTYFLRVYKSNALRSTSGILRVEPWSSQNFATWSRKFSLILVWASNSFSLWILGVNLRRSTSTANGGCQS